MIAKYIPEQSLLVQAAAQKLGYIYDDFDEGNGYLIRITNGDKWVFLSSGLVCSYPINSATSVGLASDKSHTTRILTSLGYPCIPGSHFFVTNDHINLRSPGHEYIDAFVYADKIGYPVFCKPNSGSKGDYAERVNSKKALEQYIERVKTKYETIIVQNVISGVEYRVFCFDNNVLFSYQKAPDFIVGDGNLSIKEHIDAYNNTLIGSGISLISASALKDSLHNKGMKLSSVLATGEKLKIQYRANVSTGGVIHEFTTTPRKELMDLALKCATALNLRICGVDIMDVSNDCNLSDLVVVEVNGNPSLASLLKTQHINIAVEIWVKLLKEML